MTEINFNQLWQSQKNAPDIDATVIVQKAKQLQRKTKVKIILGNLLLLATMVFVIGIVVYFQPKMITTKIGTLLVVIAIVMQIVASSQLIPILNKSNTQTKPAEYLKELLVFKKKQNFIQSTIITLYFIFLSIGLLLYMIEYTMRGSILFIVITYGLTFLWIGFSWFYIRPKTFQKQERKLMEVIENMEQITAQFSEEDEKNSVL